MTRIQSQYLPEEQKRRLHPDFLESEQHYWRMREQLLQQYLGDWVAVAQGQVVAVSQDLFDITDRVGKLGKHAYIAKVGEEDQLVFQVCRYRRSRCPESDESDFRWPSPSSEL